MKCKRCNGRLFLDRVFSDNKNYELSCIQCGDRKFIRKDSELGQWLTKKEAARENAIVR
jgi:predicted  nucleic acid-binding Zn-ribbon protein